MRTRCVYIIKLLKQNLFYVAGSFRQYHEALEISE